MRRLYAILLVNLCLAIGCVSPRRTTASSGGGNTHGQLYVATPNGILHFSNAESSTGNVAPVATITASQISSPQHLFIDTAADRLYVANQGGGSVLVFDNVSTITGATTPTRIISGNTTTLVAPVDVAVDTINNLLYVADGTSIRVFASASSVNGNTPPVRNFNLGITIGGIFLDATNNQLYVSDPADNAVDRFDSASTQDVVGLVGGAIAGADTQLSQPRGLALDASGRIIVSNSSNPVSLTTYPSASVNTGDVVPVSNIAGTNTHLQSPGQIALNRTVSNGELYVVEPLGASILVFTNMATATGNVTPARSLNGSNTGLAANAITGVAIDPTR
jgi:DNA-binding beta-propeller fold protein YncE